jgi:hypothetical protein
MGGIILSAVLMAIVTLIISAAVSYMKKANAENIKRLHMEISLVDAKVFYERLGEAIGGTAEGGASTVFSMHLRNTIADIQIIDDPGAFWPETAGVPINDN